MIFDIISGILDVLIVILAFWFFIVAHDHSERIDRSRDNIHDLQDYKWSIDDRIHDARRELKRTKDHVEGLENVMGMLFEALRMQGIATEVKTEEVKVLVKPEDTDGEDTDN